MIDRAERDRLRALCDVATPGPWCWEAHGEKSNDWTVGVAVDDNGKPLSGEIREPDFIVETVGYSESSLLRKQVIIEREDAGGYSDAKFIAACDPDTVRALLDAAEERDEWMRRAENKAFPESPTTAVERSIMRERDALRAAAEQAREALVEVGVHVDSCPRGVGIGYYKPPTDAKCDCGLAAALAALDAVLEPKENR